ncbi:MAG: multicopper oxidase family protein [Actinomycetota bacterium]|nr:multicopper oxidase family protein [Actinomycetota bacterium]
METSSAYHDSLDPTNLGNFKNKLNLPGRDGLLGFLEATADPVELAVRRERVQLAPGKETEMLTYRAERDGRVWLNPTFLVKTGAGFSASLTNELDEDTTIHWHGLHLDWRMDGHPLRAVRPGAGYRYAYSVANRGGTYWYHTHGHGNTARQVYMGLAGLFIVEDENERRVNEALGVKLGKTDLPLIIQDKNLDGEGKLVYEPDEMAWSMGYTGNVILVNMTPTPVLEVGTRLYRLRLLNGSNARLYRLAFEKVGGGELLPYRVIAADGSLLARPHLVWEVFLSPGERVDLLLDLRGFEVGEELALTNVAFDPMHREHEMGENMGHGGHAPHGGMAQAEEMYASAPRLGDGQEFYILRMVVKDRLTQDGAVPEALSVVSPADTRGAAVRPVTLSATTEAGQTRWLINGLTYEPDEFPIVVQRGAKEIWEIRNDERSMPHPMHLHGFRFRVFEKRNSPGQVADTAVDKKGRTATDLGWKDTVLVWPGETVRIAIEFSHDFEGEQLSLFHCHILEHEDAGMMINYKVVDPHG